MNKDQFMNEVIQRMSNSLSQEQASELKDTMIILLHNKNIAEETTELAVVEQISNEHLLELYAAELYADQHSKLTIEQYVRASRKMLDNFGNKNVKDITKEDITFYLIKLQQRNLSENTLINERRYLRTFFRWLNDNDYIDKNPFLRIKNPIKQPFVKKTILTEQEIALMRDSCQNTKELALFDFLLSTGVRVGELVNIKTSDVNWQDGAVYVFAPKTNKARTAYLNATALKHLIDYRESIDKNKLKCDNLFVSRVYKPLSAEGVEYILHKITENAKIDKHITVHVFRKTFATRMMRAGAKTSSVQNILGHKNFATTEKYYLEITEEDAKKDFYRLN